MNAWAVISTRRWYCWRYEHFILTVANRLQFNRSYRTLPHSSACIAPTFTALKLPPSRALARHDTMPTSYIFNAVHRRNLTPAYTLYTCPHTSCQHPSEPLLLIQACMPFAASLLRLYTDSLYYLDCDSVVTVGCVPALAHALPFSGRQHIAIFNAITLLADVSPGLLHRDVHYCKLIVACPRNKQQPWD